MKSAFWKGVGFGLTSSVITTLGVIIGLSSGTHSELAVIVGIFIMAFADGLSDAMGIHISEEAELEHTPKEQWEAALFTFISKFIFTLSFAIPVFLFELGKAIIISIIWGLILVIIFSFYIAKAQNINPHKVVIEHVIAVLLVVLATQFIGEYVYNVFT